MSQPLPYADIKVDNTVSSEKILSTINDSDTGYALEADLKHTDIVQKKLQFFYFVQRKQKSKNAKHRSYEKCSTQLLHRNLTNM